MDDNVTISLLREDLVRLVRHASARPDIHSARCPHYCSWGGSCADDLWQREDTSSWDLDTDTLKTRIERLNEAKP